MRQQFEALGARMADQPDAAPEEETIAVWAPNGPALSLFLAAATQWRTVATMAGLVWIGLDYVGVDVIARRLGIEADWADLQVLEDEALAVFSEARP